MTSTEAGLAVAIGWLAIAAGAGAETVLFHDGFDGGALKPGWSWVREDAAEWRVRDGALELRAQSGKIWSGNDAKNVLLYPPPADRHVAAEVCVNQQPDRIYEQVGLLWYVHDDQFVKLISEFIQGSNYVVMARESKDTGEGNKVLAKLVIPSPRVDLRLEVRGDEVTARYRLPDSAAWKEAARCPLKGRTQARFGVFTQNGPADVIHWARLDDFRVLALGADE